MLLTRRASITGGAAVASGPIRRAAIGLGSGLLWIVAGCQTPDRPGFDPPASRAGDRPLLQRVDGVMNDANAAIDELDRYLEHALY